jgi:hypothetical protein
MSISSSSDTWRAPRTDVHMNLSVAEFDSPSPLNGERAGVRGGNVVARTLAIRALGVTTPHPHSLSPLRGEGGRKRVG